MKITKKIIGQLVLESYTRDALDPKKVAKISSLLSRSDLKIYIRGLKLSEKSRTISLVLPDKKLYNKSLVKGLQKNVEVVEDKSLLLGVKIIDNDTIHDLSLKNSLESFIQHV